MKIKWATIGTVLGDLFAMLGAHAWIEKKAKGTASEAVGAAAKTVIRHAAPHLKRSFADEAIFARLVTKLDEPLQRVLEHKFLPSLKKHQRADFILSVAEMVCFEGEDPEKREKNEELALQKLTSWLDNPNNGERIKAATALRFIKPESEYGASKLRRQWRRLRVWYRNLLVWNEVAINDLPVIANWVLIVAIGSFLLMVALSAIPYAGKWLVFILALSYLAVLGFLLRTQRMIHAAGLFAEVDVARNIIQAIRGLKIDFGMDGEDSTLVVTAPDVVTAPEQFEHDWAILTLVGKVLYFVTLFELFAALFLMLVPIWQHPAYVPWLILVGLIVLVGAPSNFKMLAVGAHFAPYAWVALILDLLAVHFGQPRWIGPLAVIALAMYTHKDHEGHTLWSKAGWARTVLAGAAILAVLLAIAPHIGVLDKAIGDVHFWNDIRKMDATVARDIRAKAKTDLAYTKWQIAYYREIKVKGGGLNETDENALRFWENKERIQEREVVDQTPSLDEAKSWFGKVKGWLQVDPRTGFTIAILMIGAGLFLKGGSR